MKVKSKFDKQKYKTELSDMVKMFKPKFNKKNVKENLDKMKSGELKKDTPIYFAKEANDATSPLKSIETPKKEILNPEDLENSWKTPIKDDSNKENIPPSGNLRLCPNNLSNFL